MRLIDAEAAKNALYELKKKGISFIPTSFICDTIDNVPTIEAKPVVHAHWEETGMVLGKCSNCGGICPKIEYCGRCGAQMDERNDENG